MGVVEVKDEDQTALKATSQISLAAAAVLEAMERFTVGCGCVARCECQEWDPATQPPVLGFIIKENIYGRCRSHIGMGGIRLYVPAQIFFFFSPNNFAQSPLFYGSDGPLFLSKWHYSSVSARTPAT